MITKSDSHTELELVRYVLGYFLNHPKAADTLEGVVRWRLTEERVRRTTLEVSQSLEWLVRKGFLKAIPRGEQGPVYRLIPSKTGEATEFMTERGDTE
jgi:hypothetical protein